MILTHEPSVYASNYHRDTTLVGEYRANVMLYLKKMFPTVSEDILEQRLSAILKTAYKPTNIRYLHVPEPGNVHVKDGTLLDFTNSLNQDIITPYGTTYVPESTRKSLFIDYIDENQARRKVVKREELNAEAKHDFQTAAIKHLGQLNIKININVLSGVMLSNVAFRSAINYNSITATARFSTMTAYSIVEMLLESNYYFYSEDKAISWIVNLLRVYPGDDNILECVKRYQLKVPSCEFVTKAYCKHVNRYSKFSRNTTLKQLIINLSEPELTFIYYAMNLANIIRDNDSFRGYVDSVLDVADIDLVDGDIPKIAKIQDSIVSTMVMVMMSSEISSYAKDGINPTIDDIDASHPELARRIYSVYLYVEKRLDALNLLFETFIMLPIIPSEIDVHKNMIRKTVLLSDTDSILFTTINWIKWYTGDIKLSDKATGINVIIVALTFKVLEHIFAYTSASMNVNEKNIKTLVMKNEFMYDLFMRTPISKHYAGYARYREGMRQDPYKFDLKGKNFRGSDLCKTTTDFVKYFIKHIFDHFLDEYRIVPSDLIKRVIEFEQDIRVSIDRGEVTFLAQRSVSMAKSYKIPESSAYMYYMMWTEVFGGSYPAINLPQKCKEVPILEISAKNTKHVDHIRDINRDIYDRFIKFLNKYPKRTFDRVLIPLDIEIPTELRAITDYRKVCRINCFSLELILKSFNVINHPHEGTLFSDTYPNLLIEVLTNDKYTKESE